MAYRRTLRLVQLPIPQPAKGAATGNVPLAAGCLAVAAQAAGAGAGPGIDVEMVQPDVTDRLGDSLLAELLARGEPDFVGFSLYLWNSERSLHVARELKRRSPRTQVVIGGPEVGPDNAYLLEQEGWDVAVSGEAEEIFPQLLECLSQRTGRTDAGSPPTSLESSRIGVPGVALRPASGSPVCFEPPRPASFPLTSHPSPYVAGVLPVDPRRATYVETVRGCRSSCTFCFYPRSSAVLRALDVGQSRQLLAELAARGAREVVFLDPTFNHRPDFVELLHAIAEVNRDRRLRFFAEVRAEGLTAQHADLLAAAGFYKLEIGLQSVNARALAKSRRGGRPELVAAAAKLLQARGIDLLVDLIVGLPEDTPDDVRAGARFLKKHGLGDSAQVFPLSVLPGTQLRHDAEQDGLEYDRAPPYRIERTPTLTSAEMQELLLEAEDLLERRLDESARPFLCEHGLHGDPLVPEVFTVDVDRAAPADFTLAARPGAQHASLWIHGRDLWAARADVTRAIEARSRVDPHATLDVVLCARQPFPLDLLDLLETVFRVAPRSYASRATAHRGEDGQHRLSAVVPQGVSWPGDYLAALDDRVPVFSDMSFSDALALTEPLGGLESGARIVGRVPDTAFAELARRADPESVAFSDPELEQRWVEQVLCYRES